VILLFYLLALIVAPPYTMANILAVFLLAYTRPPETNESGEHPHAI